MRVLTPNRRVSINIAEADSEVRNMNRISSWAAPVANVPTTVLPAVRAVTSIRGNDAATGRVRVIASSRSAAIPSATAPP